MVLDTARLDAFVSGGVGIVGSMAHKFKWLCHCTGWCRKVSCKWGVLDNTTVDTQDIEFKRLTANGDDLMYVSKHMVNANANYDVNDNEDDADNVNKHKNIKWRV